MKLKQKGIFIFSFLFTAFSLFGFCLPIVYASNVCSLSVAFGQCSATAQLDQPISCSAEVDTGFATLCTKDSFSFYVWDGNKPDQALYTENITASNNTLQSNTTYFKKTVNITLPSSRYKNGDTVNLYAGANVPSGPYNQSSAVSNGFNAQSQSPVVVTITGTTGPNNSNPGGSAPPAANTPASPAAAPAAAAPATGGMAAQSAVSLINPTSYTNLTDFVVAILKGFLEVIGVWAVTFIVIGGFRMVISAGNEEAIIAARKTITWAILGLLVAVLSFAIIAIVQNLIGVQVPTPATTGSSPVTIPSSPVTIPSSPVNP